MMGYTHVAIGAGGALAVATFGPYTSPEMYMVVAITGALGGVAVDIDTKDHYSNPKVTDAGRSRLAILIMLGLGVALDYVFSFGILQYILSRKYIALGGAIAFLLLMLIGHFTEHRTFSHSILFTILTTVCVYCVCPGAAVFYFVGCVLHLILDMFNYPFNDHGILLFFPIKGKGIAFGVCKAARTGNKVIYFIGMAIFVAMTVYLLWKMDESYYIQSIIIGVYMIVAMHFVRKVSEKEQRHIMHMRGEL